MCMCARMCVHMCTQRAGQTGTRVMHTTPWRVLGPTLSARWAEGLRGRRVLMAQCGWLWAARSLHVGGAGTCVGWSCGVWGRACCDDSERCDVSERSRVVEKLEDLCCDARVCAVLCCGDGDPEGCVGLGGVCGAPRYLRRLRGHDAQAQR